jgi:hypothetical protein
METSLRFGPWKVIAIGTALSLSVAAPLLAANQPKAGSPCTKVGGTAVIKAKKLVCAQTPKGNRWVVATTGPIASHPVAGATTVTTVTSRAATTIDQPPTTQAATTRVSSSTTTIAVTTTRKPTDTSIPH